MPSHDDLSAFRTAIVITGSVNEVDMAAIRLIATDHHPCVVISEDAIEHNTIGSLNIDIDAVRVLIEGAPSGPPLIAKEYVLTEQGDYDFSLHALRDRDNGHPRSPHQSRRESRRRGKRG